MSPMPGPEVPAVKAEVKEGEGTPVKVVTYSLQDLHSFSRAVLYTVKCPRVACHFVLAASMYKGYYCPVCFSCDVHTAHSGDTWTQ